MSFLNTLTAWQWTILLAVPLGIIALYFLKLRRQPMEVPSTLLWRKSIEDLHVNSPWQRIRQSLLLYLQLLIVAFFLVSILRPGWRSSGLIGGRSIFLIDNSESMNAADVFPSRLEEAKRQATGLIDEMQDGAEAMVISFSDIAHIEQGFTGNRADLRVAVQNIRPTNRPTDIGDALRIAAGLANAAGAGAEETSVAQPERVRMLILSDGKFPPVPDISLGNLEAVFLPIAAHAANVGIVSFSVDRGEGGASKLQAYGRIENFSDREKKVPVDLLWNNDPIDAATLTIPANDSAGVTFDLGPLGVGILELRLADSDELPQDDRAWVAVNSSRRPKVLLITPGDKPLELALSTPRAEELADVTIAAPDMLASKDYQRAAAAGTNDLIIYDRCRPEQMPQSNTLFIAALPPLPEPSADKSSSAEAGPRWWSLGEPIASPQIIDSARNHPLMQWLDMANVEIAEARPVIPPPGGQVLLDSTKGALLAIAPRDEFEDAVLGFEIYGADKQGQPLANTNWPIRRSFPTFVYAVLEYLGGSRATLAAEMPKPGQTIALKSNSASEQLQVRTPSGTTVAVPRSTSGSFHFSATDELGPYEILDQGKTAERFTINLFNSAESDLRPPQENSLQIGQVPVPAKSGYASARRETWKWLLAAALVVLLAEWYIYNRRVYV